MNDAVVWGVAMMAAYLVGSIPFGLVLGRLKGVDIREHGSGNIGATNVRRVLGPTLGNVCFALDLLKGALPTVVAGVVLGPLLAEVLAPGAAWAWLGVAVSTILGHVFPIYLRFKGGKGVATAFGSMLALWPFTTLPALGALGVWIGTVRVWRMVSLASCAAAVSLPVLVALVTLVVFRQHPPATAAPFVIVTAALAALVVYRHRSNIARIRAGTEAKVGAKVGVSSR
ncbi:MAG: glycerol-3-phosphate 1-O-acyltransferase PlsY [Planctomycetota bacterium]